MTFDVVSLTDSGFFSSSIDGPFLPFAAVTAMSSTFLRSSGLGAAAVSEADADVEESLVASPPESPPQALRASRPRWTSRWQWSGGRPSARINLDARGKRSRAA